MVNFSYTIFRMDKEEESTMQTARRQSPTPRRPANDRSVSQYPTLVIMPFADAEEERLWNEIVEQRRK